MSCDLSLLLCHCCVMLHCCDVRSPQVYYIANINLGSCAWHAGDAGWHDATCSTASYHHQVGPCWTFWPGCRQKLPTCTVRHCVPFSWPLHGGRFTMFHGDLVLLHPRELTISTSLMSFSFSFCFFFCRFSIAGHC